MRVYNICVVELEEQDLHRAAMNGGLQIPLSPQTTMVNIKGMLQTKDAPAHPEKAGGD